MAATREGAIARARTGFDDGSFIERLRALVAVPTESHPPLRKPELERYCRFFLDRGRNHNPLVGGSNQPTATIPICLMKNIIDDVVINDGIGFAILRLVAVPISSGTGL